ncbi:hypothetical protein GCM10012275_42250 [Longimycelium tulufanense]|uniref:Uncharacterized protein n=1 Tax=Longimycelium tulufanense TaxID=907463 RepID=A0A8J3CHA3_9PSEU|nr:hypothetical protein [Longimycelium tulufanense]GGM67271.1 hypothetical protein GCM10012275_42250 [Longimycelium tulufanense]
MSSRTRVLIVVCCAAVLIPLAGGLLWRVASARGGPPVRQADAQMERVGTTDTGVRLRLLETVRVGPRLAEQVVPADTVVTAPESVTGSGAGALRCRLRITAQAGELPKIEVTSCHARSAGSADN